MDNSIDQDQQQSHKVAGDVGSVSSSATPVLGPSDESSNNSSDGNKKLKINGTLPGPSDGSSNKSSDGNKIPDINGTLGEKQTEDKGKNEGDNAAAAPEVASSDVTLLAENKKKKKNKKGKTDNVVEDHTQQITILLL